MLDTRRDPQASPVGAPSLPAIRELLSRLRLADAEFLDQADDGARLLSHLVARGVIADAEVAPITNLAQALELRGALDAGAASSDSTMTVHEGAPDLGPVVALPSLEATDRYELREEIGRGGLGRVMCAFDRATGREVAMKILAPRPNALHTMPMERARARFLTEAQITAQLQHPAIVPVYELGVRGDGRLYYTMQIVRGTTLRDAIAAYHDGYDALHPFERRRRLRALLSVFAQVCHAMAYAHSRRVIHRDLKPSNVMLGAFGDTVVLDWGLAKLFDERGTLPAAAPAPSTESPVRSPRRESDRTQSGLIAGTPAYMAPEQIAPRNDGDAGPDDLGPAADVHALGVILYEILTGDAPFRGQDAVDTMRMVLSEAPISPRRRAPTREIPGDLDALCLQCLEKEPTRRPGDAALLAREVTLFLEGSRQEERMTRLCDAAREEARHMRREFEALRRQAEHAEQRFRLLRRGTPHNADPRRKRPLWEAEAQLESAREHSQIAFNEVILKLNEALSFDPKNPRARHELGAFYLEALHAAEARQDGRQAAFFRSQVEYYNDGAFDEVLRGDGALVVDSDPPGARVSLYRLRNQDRLLQPVYLTDLGLTRTGMERLPMGHYLAVLEREGCAPTRRPIGIRRQEQVTARVRLYASDIVGADFVFVPEGRYFTGEGETLNITALRGFCIARHLVTFDDWAEYLHELSSQTPQHLDAAIPRDREFGAWMIFDGGRFRAIDRFSEAPDALLDPRSPVFAVSAAQVSDYLDFRSHRDGRRYRLPTRAEWEKTARGVDGRRYPWGFSWDASYCNNVDAWDGPSRPAPAGSFPVDVSAYGVTDLAGNLSEWSSTWADERKSRLIVCGGSWNSPDPERSCRAARLDALAVDAARITVGFRLAHDPPP